MRESTIFKKINTTPIPKGAVARMQTAHRIEGESVQANQNWYTTI